tara:strand:- start:1171 stop:1371 length:201 start_codon:yes stop_codon:yes gene_type:complete
MINSDLTKAKDYCCNYSNGNCVGAMMVRVGDSIITRVDGKKAGKPCMVNEGCDYFDNIVTKAIPNG